MVIVGGDRSDLGVLHRDLRVERGQLQGLLVLFRAIVAARKRENKRISALQVWQTPVRQDHLTGTSHASASSSKLANFGSQAYTEQTIIQILVDYQPYCG